MKLAEKFVIGIVGAPFGLNGFSKVRPCSGEIDHLLKLKSVILLKDGKETLVQVEETAAAGNLAHIRFAKIDTPEKAKTLTGAQLLVDRDQAAPLNNDEYYIEDLKGLPVQTPTGETIGHVTDIIEGGGGDLAEIKLLSGELKLIPFRKEFFSEINPQGERLVLRELWVLE